MQFAGDSFPAAESCRVEWLFIPIQPWPCGSVTLAGMRYDYEHDVLIRRDETASNSPIRPTVGRPGELWRVVSTVAVRSPLQPWAEALEHARAHALRTGGDVYRQVGSATPERIEPEW